MIRLSTAVLGVFAALATPVAAQDTIVTDTVPLDSQGYAAAPAQPNLRAQHGDWEVRCVSDTECVMTQLHRRSEQSADAVFTIVKPQGLTGANGATIEAYAEIVVPLGVFLPEGLKLSVDENEAREAPFERCINEGCVVRAPISDGMLTQLKRGGTAYLEIHGAPGKPVRIPMSLVGFTAAFNEF